MVYSMYLLIRIFGRGMLKIPRVTSNEKESGDVVKKKNQVKNV